LRMPRGRGGGGSDTTAPRGGGKLKRHTIGAAVVVSVDTLALAEAASELPSSTTASPRSLRAPLQSHAGSALAHINCDPLISVARKL